MYIYIYIISIYIYIIFFFLLVGFCPISVLVLPESRKNCHLGEWANVGNQATAWASSADVCCILSTSLFLARIGNTH